MSVLKDAVAVSAVDVVCGRAFRIKQNLARLAAPAFSAVAAVVAALAAVHAHHIADAALHVAQLSVPALLARALEAAHAVGRSVQLDLCAHSVTRAVPDTVAVID